LIEDLSFEIGALHAAYGSGLSPEAVIDEALRRLAAADDDGIFLHLRPRDVLLAEARALGAFDPAKRLWGIPFAVKDNIDVAGCPTTAACPAFAYHPETDAFVVAALRSAGAIPMGKTNLDQFATGLVGLRTPHKAPRNAIDPAIIPGGSSSGSAVAVARGIVSFALGTDTAGSGRVPAALNNIVGLKPTLGMLSNSGVVPACRTLDTISIFALSVPDAHRAFRAASVYDPADAFARPIPAPARGPVPPGLRIGVPDAQTRLFFGDKAQAGSFASTLSELDAMGATLVEVDFTPFYDVARMLYEGAWVAERMTVIEPLLRRDPQAIHPVTRQIIAAADKLSAADAFRGIYRLAELRRLADPVLDSLDMLCVPTIPTFYTVADLQADPIGPNSRLGTYTNFVNLMDLCGLAVPTAPRADGRPGSVTLLARAGRDAALAALADALHRRADVPLGAMPHHLRSAEATPVAATQDDTILAVVGAHMSGLPLNGHLTARGARFLEEAATAPDYRFYALPGGPPIRPGLVRTTRNGRSVTLELWAMPTARMGDFLATIPAPLGLGPVRLSDGRTVTGFLAEAAGTEGATDISAFAGWRAFLDAQG
jgi:allophanate hydrolase